MLSECVLWHLLTFTYLFGQAAPPLLIMPAKDSPGCVIQRHVFIRLSFPPGSNFNALAEGEAVDRFQSGEA
jgi:hypothetical protein